MEACDSLKEFLRSAEFGDAVRERRRAPQPFITISREAGAGGAQLAASIVAEMRRLGYPALQGWRVWDRELCEVIARDLNMTVLLDELAREAFRSGLADYFSQVVADAPPQALIAHKTFQAVRLIAAAGRAIIVGRAAVCATRGLSSGVHLRLVAPRRLRVDRMMARFRLARPDADRRVAELDRDRRELVRTFFQKDIADPLLYGSVWNTGAISVDEIAEVVVRLVLDAVAAGDAGRPKEAV